MSMTLAELRTFVRAFPDLDEEDLPNGVLDVLLREGYGRIARAGRAWSFYAVANTLSVAANVQTYDTSTLWGDPLSTVTNVVGTRWELKPMPHKVAVGMFTTSVGSSREPNYWSMLGDTLYLWPVPDTGYTWTVIGYRKPRALTAASDAPDVPEDFHELVAIFGLSRAYAQQDDLDAAAYYRNQFDEELKNLSKHYSGTGIATGLVMGGTAVPKDLPSRLAFPFE